MTSDLTCQESLSNRSSKVVGIASDHGGHELKEYLVKKLREAGAEVIDFGDRQLVPEDDYPDFVIPLAKSVAAGQVDRGVAICGSGVGACIVANKVNGVRACLIHDPFSVHQGVEDDDLNLICLGGLVVGQSLAWELVRRFLTAEFSGKERHCRRLEKVTQLENHPPLVLIPDFQINDQTRTPASDENSSGKKAPLKLYIIRHGETEWTFTNQHTGLTDLPLTALGEDEVREWGQRLSGIPFSRVFTSPRQRAGRTCELVGLGKRSEIEEDLAEWNYGDYEGQQSTEIRKDRPGWNIFRDGCPNGESPDEISERADRLITRLRTLTGNIALFSHGQFCGVLAARWLGLSVEEGQHFPLGTASLGILGTNPHHPDVPVLELWNSAPHEASRQTPSVHSPNLTSPKQRAVQQWENEGGEIQSMQANVQPEGESS